MNPPCSICLGDIPCIPPTEPDRPEAWYTNLYVNGREFYVHYSCYELGGPLGARAYAVARAEA